MSDYGVEIKNASGVPILSPDDRLCRLIRIIKVAPRSVGSISLPEIDGKLTLHFSVYGTVPGFKAGYSLYPSGHKVTRSGTTISWEPMLFYGSYYYTVPSHILIFIYT